MADFRKQTLVLLILFCLGAAVSFAQSNELAITAGGYFPVNSQVGASNAFALGGSFAHRIVHLPLASVYFEIPVYGSFNSAARLFSASTGSGLSKYSSLFVTPGLKLKLAPELPISPYFVAGGGLARFHKTNVTTDDTTNTGTFDVGGGLDFKIAPFISARGEVRDYYSGSPNITTGFSQREHQLVTTVGLVFRF